MGNKSRHFELTWWWPCSGIWQLVSCIIVLLDTLYLQSVALPPLPPFNPIVGGAPCAAATRPAFNTNQFSPPPSSPRTKEMHRQDLSSLSLPTNSLEGRTSQEEMRGDALTEKYAANPHPSSCYILSTHHKYSSTFLKRSTERGVFLGMYTSNIAKLGCGHIFALHLGFWWRVYALYCTSLDIRRYPQPTDTDTGCCHLLRTGSSAVEHIFCQPIFDAFNTNSVVSRKAHNYSLFNPCLQTLVICDGEGEGAAATTNKYRQSCTEGG